MHIRTNKSHLRKHLSCQHFQTPRELEKRTKSTSAHTRIISEASKKRRKKYAIDKKKAQASDILCMQTEYTKDCANMYAMYISMIFTAIDFFPHFFTFIDAPLEMKKKKKQNKEEGEENIYLA